MKVEDIETISDAKKKLSELNNKLINLEELINDCEEEKAELLAKFSL